MALRPRRSSDCLAPALVESQQKLGWKRNRLADREDVLKPVPELCGRRLAQHGHMPDVLHDEPVDREVIGVG